MRRMNLALVLLLVVGVALLGVVTPIVAGQKGTAGGGAPQPDGKFQVITTSIAPQSGDHLGRRPVQLQQPRL